MSLKNKRILITAGPTWVPIDTVRVISNIATGQTGILLAEKLRSLGAKVTLLLGPVPNVVFLHSVSSGSRAEVSASRRDASTSSFIRERETKAKTAFGIEACYLNKKIKLIRFQSFGELKNLIIKELKYEQYDIVIHSAAVSDYKPSKVYSGKIKSGIKNLRLSLAPTEKIIDLLKRIDNSITLVGFKFEPQARKDILIKKTRELMRQANLDLAVANTIDKNKYRAYILDNYNCSYGPVFNKKDLVTKLADLIPSAKIPGL